MVMGAALNAVCCGIAESWTSAVNGYEPAVVGTPEIRPVEVLSVKPGGSDPGGTLQVSGGTPPWAMSIPLYVLLMVPGGSVVVDTDNAAAGLITTVKSDERTESGWALPFDWGTAPLSVAFT